MASYRLLPRSEMVSPILHFKAGMTRYVHLTNYTATAKLAQNPAQAEPVKALALPLSCVSSLALTLPITRLFLIFSLCVFVSSCDPKNCSA
jgi:hypothetical protein